MVQSVLLQKGHRLEMYNVVENVVYQKHALQCQKKSNPQCYPLSVSPVSGFLLDVLFSR